MKPEKINIAIAEHLGIPVCTDCGNRIDPDCCHCGSPMAAHDPYDNHSGIPKGCLCGYDKQPQPQGNGIPNYDSDLNAMHEAEKSLRPIRAERFYRILRQKIGSYELAISASATQRAEAFLRALGKWKEEPK